MSTCLKGANSKVVRCQFCDGYKTVCCPTCDVKVKLPKSMFSFGIGASDCPNCRGYGKIDCPRCGGFGFITTGEEL